MGAKESIICPGLKPINSQIIKGVTYKTPLSQKLFMVWTLALNSFLGLPEAMLTYLGSEAGRAGGNFLFSFALL